MNVHIVKYLNYYIELQNPQYAVMLIGNWGCGKTFFIKNEIEKWKKEVIPDKSDNNETIYLKPIYISLNGISKISTINQKIRAEINPFLYSKGVKAGKAIIKGLIKTAIRVNVDFDGDEDNDGSVSFNPDSIGLFKSNEESVKGKRILIFDDIERCRIETDEIFGYINDFVEHYGCKVILLTDEEKIKNKYLVEISANEEEQKDLPVNYKDFKEKLVGQTFEVKSDVDSAITFFIKESETLNKNDVLSTNKDLIIHIFNASKLENLRVLKQALFDFGRFISNINPTYTQHENYNEFLKNLLYYFIVVYAEYKTGNEDVKHLDSFAIFDKTKDITTTKIKDKYRGVLNHYSIHNSMAVFPVREIFNYIDRGHIDIEVLNNLSDNTFFRNREPESWESLCSWKLLNDSDFKPLVSDVWGKFYSGNIHDPRVLFHIIGILLDLIENQLIDKKKTFVVRKSKAIIKKYFRDNDPLKLRLVFTSFKSSLNKSYCAYDHAEFQELKGFYETLFKEGELKSSKVYIKEIFEKLTPQSIDKIYEQIKESAPDQSTIYEYTPIFKNVKGKKLARKIKSFTSRGIWEFKNFIEYRYYPERTYPNMQLESYHKDELEFVIDFKNELVLNHKKREPIKNNILSEFDSDLQKIIKRLQAL